MKRLLKYTLISLTLLIAVLIAAPFFLNINDYKPLLVEQIKQATGRDIDFGEIKASLFPWVGVSIEKVRMSNAAGFSSEAFIRADNLDIQVAFMPLLHREVVIKRFIIDSPHLLLERNKDGTFNWQDLTGQEQISTGKTSGAEKSVLPQSGSAGNQPGAFKLAALTAEALRLHGGTITWNDGLTDTRIAVTKLNVDIEDVQRKRPVRFRVSAQVDGNEIVLDGQLGPLPESTRFQPEALPLQVHLKSDAMTLAAFKPYLPETAADYLDTRLGIDVSLEQRSNKVRLSAGALSLEGTHKIEISWKVQMPKASVLEIRNTMLNLDGQDLLNVKGSVHGLGGKMKYELRAKSGEISRNAVSEWLPAVSRMYDSHPNPWKQIKLSLTASGDATHAELRDMQLLMDGELVQISGMVRLGGPPNIDLRLASNSLHLDPWLPAGSRSSARTSGDTIQETATQPGGDTIGRDTIVSPAKAPAQPASAQEPDLRFLSAWKLNADVKINKLFAHGQELDNLKILAEGKHGVLTVDPFRFDYGKGNMHNKTRLEVQKYPAAWSATTRATGIQIRPVLQALADMGSLHGILEMNTQLSGSGLTEPRLTSHLNGRGNIIIRDGKIEGIDIPGAIRRVTTLGKGGDGQKSTDFSQLSGSFVIKNGVARNNDLSMASPVFRLTGNGTVNLANKTLDYHAKPKLVGTLVGQGDTATARKGLAVPIRISGPLNTPKISLDVSIKTLMQNPQALKEQVKGIKGLLKGGKKGLGGSGKDLRQRLRKGLGSLLQGL